MNQIVPVIDGELVEETNTKTQCVALARVIHDSIPVHQRHPEDWTNLAAYVSKGDLQGLQRVAESLTISNCNNTTINYNINIDARTDNSDRSRSHTSVPSSTFDAAHPLFQGGMAMIALVCLISLAGGSGGGK